MPPSRPSSPASPPKSPPKPGATKREPDGSVSRETLPQARIAVINQKGGVGKTTTAVNLAHGLATTSRRVLVIDLDPQGNATTAIGCDKFSKNASSYDFLMGKAADLAPTATRYENVALFPANISLVRAEMELHSLGPNRNMTLANAFKAHPQPHEIVLFDAPPSLGLLTMNILMASDFVLVPVQCEFLALEGLSMLIDTFDQIRNKNSKLVFLGCVLTMVDLRTNLAQQVIQDMRSHLGKKVLKTLIPRTIRLSECPSHGKSILEYDRWGAGGRAYHALTEEVLARLASYHRQVGAKK